MTVNANQRNIPNKYDLVSSVHAKMHIHSYHMKSNVLIYCYTTQGGQNYKEAMKILKLVVTRCSTLVVPPHWDHVSSLLDADLHKKVWDY